MKKKRMLKHMFKQLLLLLIISTGQNGSNAQVWDEVIKLAPSELGIQDEFGFEVSISGDKAIVSSRGDDDVATNTGAAYIFEMVDGVWIETTKLIPSDGGYGNGFSYGVSIWGDRAAITSFKTDDYDIGYGSIYIFELEDGVWTETAIISGSDLDIAAKFSTRISLFEDRFIIGSSNDDDFGTAAGAAYIFKLEDGEWVEEVKLFSIDIEPGDAFGGSVSMWGDHVVISARGYSGEIDEAGAIYIFELLGGEWTEVVRLTASDASEEDRLGTEVSMVEDALIVTTIKDSDFGTLSGAAYIFEYVDGSWSETQKLTASDGDVGDQFGYSASMSGNKVIIGSRQDNNDGGTNSGSAYIFEKIGETWEETAMITPSDANEFDEFGIGVSMSDNTVIIGSWKDDDGGSSSGSAYIFDTCPTLDFTASVDESSICLGDSVIFTATGADDFTWDLDVIDGIPYEPLTAGITTHTVSLVVDSTGCEYMSSVDLTVYDLTVTATADDTEVCLGDVVVFSGEGAEIYSWDMEVTDGTPFEPLSIGTETYTVIGSVDIGCADTSSIIVTVYDNPDVTATVDDSEICLGDVVTFNGEGAESYEWDLDVIDGESFEPLSTGTETYTVIGIDENGCRDTISIDVTVNEIEITYSTIDEMFGGDGSIDITVSGGTPIYSFDWDNDETGDFDDEEDLFDLISGTYTVVVEGEDGCSTTEIIDLDSQLGISELTDHQLTVYPNPFNDFTTVNFGTELTEEHTIIVYNIIGKEVYRNETVKGTSLEITNEQLGVGVHVLSLFNSDSEEIFSTKLLVE